MEHTSKKEICTKLYIQYLFYIPTEVNYKKKFRNKNRKIKLFFKIHTVKYTILTSSDIYIYIF